MTRFDGGGLEEAVEPGYERALKALLSLVGRRGLVRFSGADGSPFISGRLDRGELGKALQR